MPNGFSVAQIAAMNAINRAHGGAPVRRPYDAPIITVDTVARAQREAQRWARSAVVSPGALRSENFDRSPDAVVINLRVEA